MRLRFGEECSHPKCSRKTRNPAGRCFQHQGVERADPGTKSASYLPVTAARKHVSRSNFGTRTRFTRNGQDHRVSGPAISSTYPDGTLRQEVYARFGEYHRLDGPAYLSYDEQGEVTRAHFYFRGSFVSHHRTVIEMFVKASLRDDPEVAEELTGSDYRVFLDEGRMPEEVFDVLASGVTTVAGVREVFEGAPIEWVRSYEESRS